jgi:lipopolysaccharide export LptBFGC system permease protein LptF
MILEALRSIAIAISLSILVPLTIWYGVDVFYPTPIYTESAEIEKLSAELKTIRKERDQILYDQNVILNKKTEEIKKQLNNKQLETLEKLLTEKESALNIIRTQFYQAHVEKVNHHDKLALIFSGLIGIILTIFGLLFPASAIGSGLLFGGAICIALGFIRHWKLFGEKVHFFILLTSVCTIIAVGYFFFLRRRKTTLE